MMSQANGDSNDFFVALKRLNGVFARLAVEETRNRGELAALRKGLVEPGGWHPATAMVLDRAIGSVELYPNDEQVLYMTAALFSLHPDMAIRDEGTYAPSLLKSLSRLMVANQKTSDDDRASMDRRVLALLNADREDVFNHLRHLIAMFRNSGIGIDWYRLGCDLRDWDRTDRRVQRRWAREWWGAPQWTSDSASSAAVTEISAE